MFSLNRFSKTKLCTTEPNKLTPPIYNAFRSEVSEDPEDLELNVLFVEKIVDCTVYKILYVLGYGCNVLMLQILRCKVAGETISFTKR